MQCDWPDLVEECNAEAYLKFKCPILTNSSISNVNNNTDGIQFFKSKDCQRYYRCKAGRPRMLTCKNGTAFDETMGTCESAENVTGCDYLAINKEKTDIKSMRYLIVFYRTTRLFVKANILWFIIFSSKNSWKR